MNLLKSLARTSPQGARIPGFPNYHISVKLGHTKRERERLDPFRYEKAAEAWMGRLDGAESGKSSGTLTRHRSSSLCEWPDRGAHTLISIWTICIHVRESHFERGRKHNCKLMFMQICNSHKNPKHSQWKLTLINSLIKSVGQPARQIIQRVSSTACVLQTL